MDKRNENKIKAGEVWRYKEVKIIFWTLILILFFLGLQVFSKDWNGIVPCVSTRSDVEKILGKDSFPAPDSLGSYRYKKFRVSVYYDRKDKINPDKNVVKQITVYPKISILLAKYVRKIPNFPDGFIKREMDPKITHIRYMAYYFNRAESFELVVQKDDDDDREVITSFGYYGLDSDCSKLPSVAAGPTKGEIGVKEKLGSRK